MKLTEVSGSGASVMAFNDHIQQLKDLGVNPKKIGERYTLGVNLLKIGAVFSRDEDNERIEFHTPAFIVSMHDAPSTKQLYSHTAVLETSDQNEVQVGLTALLSAASVSASGFEQSSISLFVKINWKQVAEAIVTFNEAAAAVKAVLRP